MALFPLQRMKYPYHISTVFPAPALDSNGRLNGSRRSSVPSLHKPNDGLNPTVEMFDTLGIVDYRYSRFALDPRTGLFSMIRYWALLSFGTLTYRWAVTGEIIHGKIFRPYKTVSINLSEVNGSLYLAATRSTLKANRQHRF